MNYLVDKWEESYGRGENFIFYPKEEVVKFLNRFVRKKISPTEFRDIIDFSKIVRGLDFGCGIGRQTILMREFGIDAYGVDISSKATEVAKQLVRMSGYSNMEEHFMVIEDVAIPFENNFFDISISESVLDSMPFIIAKKAIMEIDRVTKKTVFLSLISGDQGDVIVETEHEHGTIQSYYNWERIQQLLAGTNLKIQWCHIVNEEGVLSPSHGGRYYLVLAKE